MEIETHLYVTGHFKILAIKHILVADQQQHFLNPFVNDKAIVFLVFITKAVPINAVCRHSVHFRKVCELICNGTCLVRQCSKQRGEVKQNC